MLTVICVGAGFLLGFALILLEIPSTPLHVDGGKLRLQGRERRTDSTRERPKMGTKGGQVRWDHCTLGRWGVMRAA